MDIFQIYLPIAGMQFNVLLLLLIGFTVLQLRILSRLEFRTASAKE